MTNVLTAKQMAAISQIDHPVPRRHWHPNGYKISIFSSLLMALGIGLFFIAGAGWSPPDEWQGDADFAVTWILLTYI